MYNEKRKQIVQAAKFYYYGHMTQEEISTMMGISRSKVSRLLLEAERLNIVRISIADPYFDLEETAAAITEKYHLNKVIVAPGGNNLDAAKTNVGAAAGEYLNSILTERSKIGISWGTTLDAFVNAFSASRKYPRACVVQLVGGLYIPNMHIDGRDIAGKLAKKIGCDLYALQLPMFVHNPALREPILSEPDTAAHFRLFDELDIALVGIGSSNFKESVVYKAGYISDNEAKLIDALSLCDICGHQIDCDGREPVASITNRLFGISLESLKKTPVVIGMCAGKDRADSIRAGIRGGYINTLIIDEIAAMTLMESEE